MNDFFFFLQCAYWCGILDLAENLQRISLICRFETITLCLLLATIQALSPQCFAEWVRAPFPLVEKKTEKGAAVCPGQTARCCRLFRAFPEAALRTVFPTRWRGSGSLPEGHRAGLEGALWPWPLLVRGEFCPLTQTDFEMTGFLLKGGSAARAGASLGTCLLDASLSHSCKNSLFAEEGHLLHSLCLSPL